jgi:pyruvate/2-oxoglutarate dehydrogenase complex dihydrolipoamide acyltransferase (E2) component
MRAKMLVDAKHFDGVEERSFVVGQELEGEDAETQVGLGHAEALPDASGDPGDNSAEVQATQAAIDAEAEGIDISTIQGTGKDGKVTKADVEAAIAAKEQG